MSQIWNDKKLAKEWIDWVENSNPSGGREKEIYPVIIKWLRKVKPKVVIDIGCGQGIYSTLIDKGINYIGIEPSTELIKRAKEKYKSPRNKFMIGDAYDIPLQDNCTDSAITIWVWSHLKDIELAANEMYRVLKPGGSYLVITANPNTYKLRRTFYKSIKEYDGYIVGTFELGNGKVLSNTNLYFHTTNYLIQSIKKSKLMINSITTFGLEKEYPEGLNIMITGHKAK